MPNENLILNNPYVEPRSHYATNPDGELDYEDVVPGRRPFREAVPAIPVRQRAQRHLMGINDLPNATPIESTVNLLRTEVRTWRESSYANTTRVSRELLHFWFKNDERRDAQKLFFAQQEAIENAKLEIINYHALQPRMLQGNKPVNLLLEITGMRRDKVEKMWTLQNRWVPAVNAIGRKHGWPRWDLLEIAEEIRDARNDILQKLEDG